MQVNGLGKGLCAAIAALLAAGTGVLAPADVFAKGGGISIEMVTVGDPGNSPDKRYVPAGIGAVGYTYEMGKYPVTNAQYCEFLNAVARADTYTLYNRNSGIFRDGGRGNYSYEVRPGYANRPVDCITWANAARFCNWLTNGQKIGAQDLTTTEDGAYLLSGKSSIAELMTVTRKSGGYVIPSANEWYKAAYYKGGSTNAYWDYATQTNSVPTRELPPGHPGSANYYSGGFLDPTYLVTEVGAYLQSSGAYGTFDQAGNIYQWTEAMKLDKRVMRGGSFYDGAVAMKASSSLAVYPNHIDSTFGFRVAYSPVPEPTTLAVLAIAAAGLACRRTRSVKRRQAD